MGWLNRSVSLPSVTWDDVRGLSKKLGAVLLAGVVLAWGCSSPPTDSEPQVYDFFGAIATYDLDGWSSVSGVHTVGGPSSEQHVGPATFILTDNTTVEVPGGTRGGSLCDGLADQNDPTIPDDCVIVGEFVEDSGDAAWFGVLEAAVTGDHVIVSNLVQIQDGLGMVAAFDEVFGFQLAERVEYRCIDVTPGPHPIDDVVLPDAATHFAVVNLISHEIVAIECGYSS